MAGLWPPARAGGGRQPSPAGKESWPRGGPDLREEAEEDSATGGGDPADVITETGAGGAEQRWEQGGQIHGEEAEDPREEAHCRNPGKKGAVIAHHTESPEHREEETGEHHHQPEAVAEPFGQPAGEKIAGHRHANDEEESLADEALPRR